ncbi:hypothetical protein RSAG8_11701, partial [Rhizoctonia solani AG-8 WAC10335]
CGLPGPGALEGMRWGHQWDISIRGVDQLEQTGNVYRNKIRARSDNKSFILDSAWPPFSVW